MTGLYKAKSKKTGEWVEGYYVKYQPCASKSEWVHGIVPTYASALYIIEIDPETLCRYIGKNDDNFEKIMEHDVISINTYDYMEPAEDFFGEVVKPWKKSSSTVLSVPWKSAGRRWRSRK